MTFTAILPDSGRHGATRATRGAVEGDAGLVRRPEFDVIADVGGAADTHRCEQRDGPEKRCHE